MDGYYMDKITRRDALRKIGKGLLLVSAPLLVSDMANAAETAGAGSDALVESGPKEQPAEAVFSELKENAILPQTIDAGKWNEYRKLVDKTIALSDQKNDCAIVVDKMAYWLGLYCDGKLAKEYVIDLGYSPVDAKLMEGDRCTPEGEYEISVIKDIGQTVAHRSLIINYPNDKDRTRFEAAKRNGLIPKRSRIGGSISIHGQYMGWDLSGKNWTWGCVAVKDKEMDELFPFVSIGTPVTIVKYGTKDFGFYKNLKPREGY